MEMCHGVPRLSATHPAAMQRPLMSCLILLEFQLQPELDDASIRQSAADGSEGSGVQHSRGIAEGGMVPGVEELRQESKVEMLPQPGVLGNAQVPQVRAGSPHRIAAEISVTGSRRGRERARIQIFVELR